MLLVTYKILPKIVLNRLEHQIDDKIGEYQGVFQKGRSCPEQMQSLNLKYKHLGNFVKLFQTLREYRVD